MGRFLLQIYIFQRHEQNICCFFIYFYLRFIIKKPYNRYGGTK